MYEQIERKLTALEDAYSRETQMVPRAQVLNDLDRLKADILGLLRRGGNEPERLVTR